jgi:hypothetical protein
MRTNRICDGRHGIAAHEEVLRVQMVEFSDSGALREDGHTLPHPGPP